MGDVCLPGLQGFPVQITGWSGITDKIPYIIPNDIQLQFSPSETPMAFDKSTGALATSGNNTFFMNGTQYTVRSVNLSAPKQEGLNNFSGSSLAEFQLWASPTATSVSKSEIAVLIIPIYKKPAENEFGSKIWSAVTGKPTRLIDCIPYGPGTEIVKYTTCIETDQNKSVNINVAYWSSGAVINEDISRILSTISLKSGIPNVFGFRVLTTFVQFADEKQTKGKRNYSIENQLLQPYKSSVVLSVASSEFKNAFRIIPNFDLKKTVVGLQDTSSYKCIPIDRSRDIKDGRILIDPKTGNRLDDEIKIAEDQKKEALGLDEEPTTSVRSIWITICIILGVLLGIGLIAIISVLSSQYIFNKKTMDFLPTLPGTTASATS
jgi:hypothetical protein